MIYIRTSSNISLPNLFTDNNVATNISSCLFDGEIEQNSSTLKFKFDQNCISPFDKTFHKTERLLLFDENGLNEENFNNVFQSDCGEFIISQTIPIITETQEIKTQTPTKTRSMALTPTKSISLTPTKTFVTTATKTNTPMPTKTIITHTEDIKTSTQSIPIITHTNSIITITKDIKTPTQSLPVVDDDTNKESKNDKKEFHIFSFSWSASFFSKSFLLWWFLS